MRLWWGFSPHLDGRAYIIPPDPVAEFFGAYLTKREEGERIGYREGEERRRKGMGENGRECREPTSKRRGCEGERKGK